MFGTLVGKVGGGEIRKSMAGPTPVVNFSVGERKWVGQGKGFNGSAYAIVWWDVAFFGTRAEKIASLLTKDKLVAVSGEAGIREFVHNGEKRTKLELKASEVQLLDKPPAEAKSSPTADYPPGWDDGL